MAYELKKAKILIVDDMAPMLNLATSVLRIFGFEDIIVAPDGETAFEILCKADPDLVITDWMMEPINGLELADKIRKSPMSPNPYVPILMMTGFSSRVRVESARDSGITEFLVKPFSSQDLYNRISQIIEKPRQFIDSGEFFGPDRRRRKGEDYRGPSRRQSDSKKPETEEEKKAAGIIEKLSEDAKKVS